MTTAIIYLIAAILALLTALVPLIVGLLKWAAGKGLLKLLLSLLSSFLALAFYLLAIVGSTWAGWGRTPVFVFLVLSVLMAVIAFSTDSTEIKRHEIAIFVVQVSSICALIALIAFPPSSSSPEKVEPSPNQPLPSASPATIDGNR
jgi:hypothetical protein